MVGHTIYYPRKGSILTSTSMVGHTIYHPEKGYALIFDHGRTLLPPCQKGSTLTSDHGRNSSCHHVRRDLHLHLTMGGPSYHHFRRAPHLRLTMGGTNPSTMLDGLTDSSLSIGRNLDLKYTLELHCSSLHHTKMQFISIK